MDQLDSLVAAAYHELRAIAHRQLEAGRRGRGTLDTTGLVHEAYLKLASGAGAEWRDEAHFRAVAAVAMRHILVDRARARISRKRGGGLQEVELDDLAGAGTEDADTLLAIDDALARLATVSPRLARLVELRYFGGLTEEEAATTLGVTVRTAQRDWVKARMLLRRALET